MRARGIVVGVALLVFGEGCGIEEVNVGDCEAGQVADLGHRGADGQPDPCHLRDPPRPATECAGGEIVHRPLKWDGPVLLWFGQEGEAPSCPYDSLPPSYEGHADLVAPSACEACTCEPPTGVCGLPSMFTVSTEACGSFQSGALTSYNAPAPWDGQCDGGAQVAAGAAHALTIDALTIDENGCAPGPTVPTKVISSYWKTLARGCEGKGWPAGPTSLSLCIPDGDAVPPGFRLCVAHDGDLPCPAYGDNSFTEPHVFYDGAQDDRQCSGCACGPPLGSVCTATISIYKGGDATCNGAVVAQHVVSSVEPVCMDIAPPGQALGSKSAGPTVYTPGKCEPTGGEPSGVATEIGPTTFCCVP